MRSAPWRMVRGRYASFYTLSTQLNPTGDVFDVTRSGFEKLRSKSSDLILQALKTTFPKVLNHYLYRTHWTTVGDETDADTIPTISAELDHPLRVCIPSYVVLLLVLNSKQAMKEGLLLLEKALNLPEYRRICRQAFAYLDQLLWNELLMRQVRSSSL